MGKASIFTGTSGYSYQHWDGLFYPPDIRQSAWLEHYAKFFDTVELNVTFYRLPQESAFLSWYRRTPKHFTFSVKGSRFITHIKRLKDCSGPLKLFFDRVKLLKEKLGPILWQLPPLFKCDQKRLHIFTKLLKKYRNVRHVFEFRNETWFSDSIFDLLREEGISLCSADWPKFSKTIVPTTNFIYLRRHGTTAKRYGGNYSSVMLKKDAKIIQSYLKEKKDVYIYFNNDAYGYAVKNAMELKKIVERKR